MTDYYQARYDNEASGPFVAEGANLTWTASVGFIVKVIDNGTTGTLIYALVSGVPADDGDVITQGSTTADTDLDSQLLLYPAYFREDVTVPSTGIMVWSGPALGATHSFFFDGQTANVVAGEILTFSPGGETCEVITVESDAGVSGELSVRFISNVDQTLPADDDTFTGDIIGDGTVNGVIHDRAYTPLHLHRLLSHLSTEGDIAGDDDLSRVDARPSSKDTGDIVNLLSTMVIDDTIAQHMYGGSVKQNGSDTLFSGVNVQVTSPLASTQPVLIQDDGIITDYWKNAFMPHSVQGNIRLLKKTRDEGVDIDGKRIRGGLLEYGEVYFFGGTTLGSGFTSLALFSGPDGNNNTASGTVAGAPYNTIVETEGLQLINYLGGQGLQEFGYSLEFGSASSAQAYERTKYNQRRGTAETLFGRNCQLLTGVNLNWAFDTATGTYTEDEILAWGTIITYSGQTTNFSIGEVINFVGTGDKGRLLYDNDAGATGLMVLDMEPGILPLATDTLTGVTSGGDGDVDTVTDNITAGTALLIAYDDDTGTGNLYTQQLTGLIPANNQVVYGSSSDANSAVNGSVNTRNINSQYIGSYTGSNYNPTNFGFAIDVSDSILGDKLLDLANVLGSPPDNQTGIIRQLKNGDAVTVYPWNGSTLDANGDPTPTFAEATLDVALIAATSTDVDVDVIPDNTPQTGWLRVERDSDSNLDLLEYVSHTGTVYTLGGSTPTALSACGIGNTVMRAPLDLVRTADGDSSFTAIKAAGTTQYVARITNGTALNGPIKPNIQTPIFGATGFDINASRIDDS